MIPICPQGFDRVHPRTMDLRNFSLSGKDFGAQLACTSTTCLYPESKPCSKDEAQQIPESWGRPGSRQGFGGFQCFTSKSCLHSPHTSLDASPLPDIASAVLAPFSAIWRGFLPTAGSAELPQTVHDTDSITVRDATQSTPLAD